MKKVFNVDVLGCSFCGSGMTIVSCISDYQIDVLECLVGYDAEARGPPWHAVRFGCFLALPMCSNLRHMDVVE